MSSSVSKATVQVAPPIYFHPRTVSVPGGHNSLINPGQGTLSVTHACLRCRNPHVFVQFVRWGGHGGASEADVWN
jgi:hypothetical protein